jgi:hypothetical protein
MPNGALRPAETAGLVPRPTEQRSQWHCTVDTSLRRHGRPMRRRNMGTRTCRNTVYNGGI